MVAFFLGGMVAARYATVPTPGEGAFMGLMVGVAAIAAMVFLVGIGIGNVLGGAAANLGDIAELATQWELEAEEAARTAEAAFEDAEGGAWGTLIGLVAALVLSAVGGLLGARQAPAVQPAAAERR